MGLSPMKVSPKSMSAMAWQKLDTKRSPARNSKAHQPTTKRFHTNIRDRPEQRNFNLITAKTQKSRATIANDYSLHFQTARNSFLTNN